MWGGQVPHPQEKQCAGLVCEDKRDAQLHSFTFSRMERGEGITFTASGNKNHLRTHCRNRPRSHIRYCFHFAFCIMFLWVKNKKDFTKDFVYLYVSLNIFIHCLIKRIGHISGDFWNTRIFLIVFMELFIPPTHMSPLFCVFKWSHSHLTSWRVSVLSVNKSWSSDSFPWSMQYTTCKEIRGPNGT